MKRLRESPEPTTELNLLDLPRDALVSILTWCTIPEVLACSTACHALYDAGGDDRLWRPPCLVLWLGKQHYHDRAHLNANEASWKMAYVQSWMDSKRTRITIEEATQLHWIYSRAVSIKVRTHPVQFERSFITEQGRLPIPWWMLDSENILIDCFEFRSSRNPFDWGWIFSHHLHGVYQTYDANCISLAHPILLVDGGNAIHGRYSSPTSVAWIENSSPVIQGVIIATLYD